MLNPEFLFSNKWKTGLALVLVISLSFLDKIIPPFGIPLALIAIFLLFRWRKLSINFLGLFKPKNWVKTILIGLVAAIGIQVFSIFILTPILELLGVESADPAIYESIVGNKSMLIMYLCVSWTTAGLGEELIYRSFFLGQTVAFFATSKYKWIISLIISSVIFGFFHFNNGIDAIISTGVTGFILGLIYLYTDRNIWAVYFAHSITNTIAFLIIYSGLYKSLL